MTVLNKKKDLQVDKDKILYGIYAGQNTVEKLNKELYLTTADELKKAVYKGYQGTLSDFVFDSPDYETLKALRENIYMFSAAKTFQQTNEMSDALVGEDGKILSFSEFKEAAGEIFDTYNKDWLEAEYNTSIASARSAAKWNDIEKNKSTRPYLRYSAVDEAACEICAPLDDITLPIDDPFWDDNVVPQHFNCECVIEQLDEDDLEEVGGLSDEDEVKEAVDKSSETKNPLFDFNPGKDKVVFQDSGENKHPYFEVPEKYRELAANNFNLPISEED